VRRDLERHGARIPSTGVPLSNQPLDDQTEAIPPSNLKTTTGKIGPPQFATSGRGTTTGRGAVEPTTPDTPEIGGMKKFLAAMLISTNPNLANVIMQGGFTQFEKNRQAGVDLETRKTESTIGLQDARANEILDPTLNPRKPFRGEQKTIILPFDTPFVDPVTGRATILKKGTAAVVELQDPDATGKSTGFRVIGEAKTTSTVVNLAGGPVGRNTTTGVIDPIIDPDRPGERASLQLPNAAQTAVKATMNAVNGLNTAADLFASVGGRSQLGRLAQQAARPIIGAQASGGLEQIFAGTTTGEELSATIENLKTLIGVQRFGLRVSNEEARRLGRILPGLGEASQELFSFKLNLFVKELQNVVRVTNSQFPNAFSREEVEAINGMRFTPQVLNTIPEGVALRSELLQQADPIGDAKRLRDLGFEIIEDVFSNTFGEALTGEAEPDGN